MDFENVALAERSHTQKARYHIIAFLWNTHKWQLRRDRTETAGSREGDGDSGGGEMGGMGFPLRYGKFTSVLFFVFFFLQGETSQVLPVRTYPRHVRVAPERNKKERERQRSALSFKLLSPVVSGWALTPALGYGQEGDGSVGVPAPPPPPPGHSSTDGAAESPRSRRLEV